MSTPLESLVEQSANINLFAPDSRYANLRRLELLDRDGKAIPYLKQRYLPKTGDLAIIKEYAVQQDDRLDLVAWKELGDPLLFWRVADANQAMNPLELAATPNLKLKIALPEGVPAPQHA